MEELISTVSKMQNSKLIIKQWCIQNDINQPIKNAFTYERISQFYEKLLDKTASFKKNDFNSSEDSKSIVWAENQLSLFQWTAIVVGLTTQTHLKDFKNSQFELLSQIFKHKENYIIQYEVKCMTLKGKQKRKNWEPKQEEILQKLVQKNIGNNKWNQIARQLYKNSNGIYFRQGKHCRERWMITNGFLKLKNEWCLQGDIELLQLVHMLGQKWKQIAQKFSFDINQLELKRRLKTIFAEAGFDISNAENQDKETVSYLLKAKKSQFKKNKRKPSSVSVQTISERKLSKNRSLFHLKACHQNESSLKQNICGQDSQGLQQGEKKDQGQPQVLDMKSMGSEGSLHKPQNYDQMRQQFNEAQLNEINRTIWSMEYTPIIYCPQMYQMVDINAHRNLSYFPCNNFSNVNWPYMFY